MNLKDLEYFKTVCQHKSITKAAHALYLTPQGLSKIIKNVENELGTSLLNRTGTGVTLTEAGAFLYERLPDFLNTYHDLCSEIRCIDQRQNHEIDLLSAYGILRLVTPECLVDFRQKYPHIKLNYREYPDRQVERMFREGEGNVAFTVGGGTLRDTRYTLMERYEIKLLVNRRHPLSRKKSVSVREIQGEKLYIESSEFHIHHLITSQCKTAGFEPDIVFETSGFSLCHKMVQQNKGISVTVDFIFEDMHQEDLVMLPFEEGPFYWETYMLTREGKADNPDIQLFHGHVMHWMEEIRRNAIKR